MERDKQIEEMVKDLHSAYAINKLYTEDVAQYLYNAGYRKASEVAREIFEQIDDTMELVCAMTGLDIYTFGRFAELKKMYTEGEG